MAIEGGKKYTVSDIEALPERERAEVIDGGENHGQRTVSAVFFL